MYNRALLSMYGFIVAFILAIIAFFINITNDKDIEPNVMHAAKKPKSIVISEFIENNPSKYLVVVGDTTITANDRKVIFIDHPDGDVEELDINAIGPITKIKSQMTVELVEQLQQLDCILIVITKASTDSERLLDLARQYAMIEMIKPKISLVSLLLPMYNQRRAEFVQQVNRNSYKEDFSYIKDLGIDFITDYYTKQCVFYEGRIVKTYNGNFLITEGLETKCYT